MVTMIVVGGQGSTVKGSNVDIVRIPSPTPETPVRDQPIHDTKDSGEQ